MKLKGIFLFMVALTSIIIVGMIAYMEETVQEVVRLSKGIDTDSSAKFFDYNSEVRNYTAQ